MTILFGSLCSGIEAASVARQTRRRLPGRAALQSHRQQHGCASNALDRRVCFGIQKLGWQIISMCR